MSQPDKTPENMTEKERMDAIKARGAWPKSCGPDGIDAPARGPLRVMRFKTGQVNPAGKTEVKPLGFGGRDTAKVCDVFDLIEAYAKREVFSPPQLAIARRYAGIVERHSKGAIKCSTLDDRGGGSGGTGSDFMDAYLQEGVEIEGLRKIVVAGAGLTPSARMKGSVISPLELLDCICLLQLNLSQILKRFGWSVSGPNIAKLVKALAEIFDRMNGTREPRSRTAVDIQTSRAPGVGEAAQTIWDVR
jgi:hypothetical protein